MMKTNDLRVGNYTKFMLNDEDYEIISIDVKDLELIEKKQGVYEPIPLTEEWLLKFGFEWKGNKFLTVFTPCGKALVYIGDNFFKFVNITIEIQIKYVNQLQNLYFTLTGEELTFKSE